MSLWSDNPQSLNHWSVANQFVCKPHAFYWRSAIFICLQRYDHLRQQFRSKIGRCNIFEAAALSSQFHFCGLGASTHDIWLFVNANDLFQLWWDVPEDIVDCRRSFGSKMLTLPALSVNLHSFVSGSCSLNKTIVSLPPSPQSKSISHRFLNIICLVSSLFDCLCFSNLLWVVSFFMFWLVAIRFPSGWWLQHGQRLPCLSALACDMRSHPLEARQVLQCRKQGPK